MSTPYAYVPFSMQPLLLLSTELPFDYSVAVFVFLFFPGTPKRYCTVLFILHSLFFISHYFAIQKQNDIVGNVGDQWEFLKFFCFLHQPLKAVQHLLFFSFLDSFVLPSLFVFFKHSEYLQSLPNIFYIVLNLKHLHLKIEFYYFPAKHRMRHSRQTRYIGSRYHKPTELGDGAIIVAVTTKRDVRQNQNHLSRFYYLF